MGIIETAGPDVATRNDVASWDEAHRYTPAPRHRRRLLQRLMSGLTFENVLDAGCAQPFLLKDVVETFGVRGYGCDVSDEIVEQNRRSLPDCEFRRLDLTTERWPDERTFDVVVCSEVLEHVVDWRQALSNLVAMTRRHLLITVPGGQVREMDRLVGHVDHFRGPELVEALEAEGCRVERLQHWGWPVHSAYKSLISLASPESLYASFSGGQRYGPFKKAVSEMLYGAFFLNDLSNRGDQILILAHKGETPRLGARAMAGEMTRESSLRADV